ncbi:putative signal peptide protein [Puccinia sorghi]|uniref:Putative signal peptide protein n=1 Tax=Puccinia sorghi TaxID=27349 RepID=A0A0L6V1H7_9BASI|nr:putative signal peptide protein [Puccinia sorghi]
MYDFARLISCGILFLCINTKPGEVSVHSPLISSTVARRNRGCSTYEGAEPIVTNWSDYMRVHKMCKAESQDRPRPRSTSQHPLGNDLSRHQAIHIGTNSANSCSNVRPSDIYIESGRSRVAGVHLNRAKTRFIHVRNPPGGYFDIFSQVGDMCRNEVTCLESNVISVLQDLVPKKKHCLLMSFKRFWLTSDIQLSWGFRGRGGELLLCYKLVTAWQSAHSASLIGVVRMKQETLCIEKINLRMSKQADFFLGQVVNGGINSFQHCKKNLLNCLQWKCSMLRPRCHPNSTFLHLKMFWHSHLTTGASWEFLHEGVKGGKGEEGAKFEKRQRH